MNDAFFYLLLLPLGVVMWFGVGFIALVLFDMAMRQIKGKF